MKPNPRNFCQMSFPVRPVFFFFRITIYLKDMYNKFTVPLLQFMQHNIIRNCYKFRLCRQKFLSPSVYETPPPAAHWTLSESHNPSSENFKALMTDYSPSNNPNKPEAEIINIYIASFHIHYI